MRVFVAGATGSVGFEFVRLAKARGCTVHTLSRNPERAKPLEGVADRIHVQDATAGVPDLSGTEVLVSALGAAVTAKAGDKRRYSDVDFVANMRLLEAAQAARVPRFVYVAAHVGPGYRDTAYIRAHEQFVEQLARSGLSHTVVRPTGIFPVFRDFLEMARRGMGIVIGDGSARTNPVHHSDVAQTIMDNLIEGPADIPIGGPQIFSRRQIVELAFEVSGKKARIVSVPAGVFRAGAKLAGLGNPRLGELLEFAAAVSVTTCVAPAVGRLSLEAFFRAETQSRGI